MTTKPGVLSQDIDALNTDKRAQIDELIEQARLADRELRQFIRDLTHAITNRSGHRISINVAPLKTRDSAARKVGIMDWNDNAQDVRGEKSPYEVKDIARATITFATVPEMYAVKQYISSRDEYIEIRHYPNSLKDLWGTKGPREYKDIKFFLAMRINYHGRSRKHMVELQLNTSRMAGKGKAYGHAFYNIIRLGVGPGGGNTWIPHLPGSVITIPGNKKGEIGDKLQKTLTGCKGLVSSGDEEIKHAITIMTQFLRTRFRYDRNKLVTYRDRGVTKTKQIGGYLNGNHSLRIYGGAYNWRSGVTNTDAAISWALDTMSGFVFARYTHLSRHVMTTTASNIHGR